MLIDYELQKVIIVLKDEFPFDFDPSSDIIMLALLLSIRQGILIYVRIRLQYSEAFKFY